MKTITYNLTKKQRELIMSAGEIMLDNLEDGCYTDDFCPSTISMCMHKAHANETLDGFTEDEIDWIKYEAETCLGHAARNDEAGDYRSLQNLLDKIEYLQS